MSLRGPSLIRGPYPESRNFGHLFGEGGYLNVLSNSRWRERWCRVKENMLILHKDRADLKTHIVSIPLRGCEVIPGLDSKHPLTFRLLRNGQEVAVLEASSSEDMGRWIGILLAETGSSTDPGALHYDYIDVEMSANVIQTAKQTFCFMNRRVLSTNPYVGGTANGYAHPSGTALHYDDVPCISGSWGPDGGFPAPRGRGLGEEALYDNAVLYDNLPSPKIFARYPPADRKAARPPPDKLSCNHYKHPASSGPPSSPSVTNTSSLGRASLGLSSQLKGKKPPPVASNGVTGKGKTLSSQQKKADSAAGVKRTPSNADQYKYGKNRVEADAKRLQAKEEELLKRREGLRERLAQLRKERKGLRAAIEVNTGRKTQVILEEKLKKLEEECKLKETERVNLELELTEVKESLRKALAGGITLGLAIEPRSGTSSPQEGPEDSLASPCRPWSHWMEMWLQTRPLLTPQAPATPSLLYLHLSSLLASSFKVSTGCPLTHLRRFGCPGAAFPDVTSALTSPGLASPGTAHRSLCLG
ncbi:hypothetical protein J1605_009128 [Eschrichtius robustus]|uniref:PH domain-containing protein n=1 Tax=Eschrichtius robustus TaxID=9764 RepID=A0AB34GTK2_ESCRO|nr:hypothetical protein J1605_009128 [Eschrichtius robustus]